MSKHEIRVKLVELSALHFSEGLQPWSLSRRAAPDGWAARLDIAEYPATLALIHLLSFHP